MEFLRREGGDKKLIDTQGGGKFKKKSLRNTGLAKGEKKGICHSISGDRIGQVLYFD